MVDFSKVTLPFSASDLLQSGFSIIFVFGPFILLGLAIVFAPKLINHFGAVLADRRYERERIKRRRGY